jgi:hypothetical protein
MRTAGGTSREKSHAAGDRNDWDEVLNLPAAGPHQHAANEVCNVLQQAQLRSICNSEPETARLSCAWGAQWLSLQWSVPGVGNGLG